MNAQEIYTQAAQTTKEEFVNLFNRLNDKETAMFNRLVNMGDRKELALWTVIAERYNPANNNNEFYINAYER